MKTAILTSKEQWFIPYALKLQDKLNNACLFYTHEDIDDSFDIVFILSYHCLIPKSYLSKHRHNLVIHESALPLGKGWAPLFWQVLENKNVIPFTMFEASDETDNGDIYMQEVLTFTGYELNEELRKKQALLIEKMCLQFLNNYKTYKTPTAQLGAETFYPKRTQKESQLDSAKSLKEQFNLLRIVNNQEYPAFFKIDGHTYKLTIEKMEN